MKKILLLGGCAVAFFIPRTRAQSVSPNVLNVSGGTKTVGNNVYDWSVGEMALVSTVTTPNLIVTQGFLQPADETVGITDNIKLYSYLKVYPNPAADIVYLDCNMPEKGDLAYILQDITGKQITSNTAHVNAGASSVKINLQGLASASYMLSVSYKTANSIQNASFKIEKHN